MVMSNLRRGRVLFGLCVMCACCDVVYAAPAIYQEDDPAPMSYRCYVVAAVVAVPLAIGGVVAGMYVPRNVVSVQHTLVPVVPNATDCPEQSTKVGVYALPCCATLWAKGVIAPVEPANFYGSFSDASDVVCTETTQDANTRMTCINGCQLLAGQAVLAGAQFAQTPDAALCTVNEYRLYNQISIANWWLDGAAHTQVMQFLQNANMRLADDVLFRCTVKDTECSMSTCPADEYYWVGKRNPGAKSGVLIRGESNWDKTSQAMFEEFARIYGAFLRVPSGKSFVSQPPDVAAANCACLKTLNDKAAIVCK